MKLDVYQATRYVVPLKEGGSLPAVVDTEDGGLFVAKFRGAGQGSKALLAELLVAGIDRALELPIPEVVLLELGESFGRTERDPEIQDILAGSRGLNFGMRYLEGAFNFDPQSDEVDAELAASIVWLDAFVTNIDRTAKNPNLMWLDQNVWMIDHGAALYFHHNWSGVDDDSTRSPFPRVRDHVLLAASGDVRHADARLAPRLTDEVIDAIASALPDGLLMDTPPGVSPPFASADENRAAYRRYFASRLASPRAFVDEAVAARDEARARPERERKSYRR